VRENDGKVDSMSAAFDSVKAGLTEAFVHAKGEPAEIEQLWREAKITDTGSHPNVFLQLASRVKLPTGRATLQNLVCANCGSSSNTSWILKPPIESEPAIQLASLATHAWKIAGAGDEEKVAVRLQTVAEHCSRALLGSAFFWCRMHEDAEPRGPRVDRAYASAYGKRIKRADWTNFNLIRSPQIWMLAHRNSPIDETVREYFASYAGAQKGLAASLIGATALTWIDEAVGLLIAGKLAEVIAFSAIAGNILCDANFYDGWDAAEEENTRNLDIGDSSQAAKHLAKLSARGRQDTTAKLIAEYRTMGVSKNLAAPILAEKFSLSNVTVRDKLKGV
jgi:hypothetical protein